MVLVKVQTSHVHRIENMHIPNESVFQNRYLITFYFKCALFIRKTLLANRTSNECIGLQKRYRICNEQVKVR